MTVKILKLSEWVDSCATATQTETTKHKQLETMKEVINMTEIIKNVNFNRVDLLNVVTSADDIKEVTEPITITGVLIYTTPDKETGEVKTVGAVRTEDGHIYGFTSATLLESTAMMVEVLNESDVKGITMKVISKQSNNKRTFYQFVVTDIITTD